MTAAPAPPPAEQAVIDRFGICDEERATEEPAEVGDGRRVWKLWPCGCAVLTRAEVTGHVCHTPAAARPRRRLAVDADGFVWWDNGDGSWSMVRTNPDNSPIPQPVTYYAAIAALESR